MKTIFTRSQTNFGCYGIHTSIQVITHLPVESFTIEDVLNADISLKDKAWFIRYNCEFTSTQFKELAIGCALCVLPIYEAKYPGNKAPREAIEAAKAYLAGTINTNELKLKRKAAADAAYTAAYAAAAADAADAAAYTADAAYAAYAGAYAAAAAAYAAYTGAYAAAAAAYAAYAGAAWPNYQILLLNFFKEFTKQ